jgi:hypothetical protein
VSGRKLLIVVALLLSAGDGHAQLDSQALNAPVTDVDYSDRTTNILKALAQKYHVVIGASGILIGDDNEIVRISIAKGSLKDVFEQVVEKDPRFEWHQTEDGSIDFRLRRKPLPLIDVNISAFDVDNPQRSDFPNFLMQVTEIKAWQSDHHCLVQELIIGRPPTNWGQFSLHLRNQPFGSAMNQIASKSGSYFWSAIQYNSDPCSINITP